MREQLNYSINDLKFVYIIKIKIRKIKLLTDIIIENNNVVKK